MSSGQPHKEHLLPLQSLLQGRLFLRFQVSLDVVFPGGGGQTGAVGKNQGVCRHPFGSSNSPDMPCCIWDCF